MRPEEVPPRAECPEPARWSAPDGNATENEVSALVGAFVAALKPDYVIETGSYHGDTTEEIGAALQALGRGRLLSIEMEPEHANIARMRVVGLPVTVTVAKASEVLPDEPIDLIFIDAGTDDRIHQVRHFKEFASPRCVILYHDSALLEAAPGIKEMFADMQTLVDEGTVQPWLKLPTPRGLALTRYR